jgi:hypothetical protein
MLIAVYEWAGQNICSRIVYSILQAYNLSELKLDRSLYITDLKMLFFGKSLMIVFIFNLCNLYYSKGILLRGLISQLWFHEQSNPQS